MKKVVTLQKPDIKGKLVDKIQIPKNSFMLVFDSDKEASIEDIKIGCFKALYKISQSNKKRLRERDFVVITGTKTNRVGIRVFSICLPEGISSEVANAFYNAFNRFHIIDAGTYPFRDLSSKPLGRYSHGKLISYTSPTADKGWLPQYLETIKALECSTGI